MASITVRNLDDDVRRRLRERAASNERSMEAEVREILTEAVNVRGSERGLGQAIVELFAGIDADLPEIDRSQSMQRPIDL